MTDQPEDDQPEPISDIARKWIEGLRKNDNPLDYLRYHITVGGLIDLTDEDVTPLTTENLVLVADMGRRLLREAVKVAYDHGDELFLDDAKNNWPLLLEAMLKMLEGQTE